MFWRKQITRYNKVVDHGIRRDDRVLRELRFDRLDHCLKDVLTLIDELWNEDELNEFEDGDQHLYIRHELE